MDDAIETKRLHEDTLILIRGHDRRRRRGTVPR